MYGFQKESFCTSKGVLLGGQRSPFGRQKGYICNAKGLLFLQDFVNV